MRIRGGRPGSRPTDEDHPSGKSGRCELGTTPRGLIADQEGLLKLVFHGRTGVLLGVHVICEIASEISGTGQGMIRNGATIEDVIRMAYNTPTYNRGALSGLIERISSLGPDVIDVSMEAPPPGK